MLLGTALGLGLLAAAVAAWTALTGPVSAKDGSLVGTGTPSTVAGANSRYRYTVLSPARPPRVTVGADANRRPEPLTVPLPITVLDEPKPPDPNFLAFTQTPRRPGNLVSRTGIAGHRASGQPVRVRQLGDPQRAGELVVFECLDGEPCDAGHLQPNAFGCPDPYADIYVVPSRVSESERGIASRIVERLTPAATVWLHQGNRPIGVRAWGENVTLARRLARRADLRFRRAPVLAGSAEEWLARDMPGTVRISIDLPGGHLATRLKMRLNSALARLGREVSEDGEPPRKG